MANGRECYAKDLGGCEGGISREHFVSNTILKQLESGGTLNVDGFPLGGTRNGGPVSANSMTARVLCEKHNSILSPIDVEGEAFLMFFFRSSEVLAKGTLADDSTTSLDGLLVERWLLKYACGLITSGNAGMPDARVNKAPPPLGLLQVLFGQLPLGGDLGLYSLPDGITSGSVNFSLSTTWAPRGGDSFHLTGVELFHYGLKNFLKIVADLPPTEGIDLKNGVYRPDYFQLIRTATGRSARLELRWPFAARGNGLSVPVVTRGDLAGGKV